ncbi:uncharacterized protein LOC128346967 [Hemicordylus capensis]|uniref:uncharacterized protein LOC128346967 n=1 Tax=Hemicordylus capensis TaxID=884348 RepID=UPI0023034199|nr:uncharacterized protein LOC128346967 [Hemicordylus capensis]
MEGSRVRLICLFVALIILISPLCAETSERQSCDGTSWSQMSSLEVPEGGNASIILKIYTKHMILLVRCDSQTHTQKELFVGRLWNLRNLTNETEVSLFNQTFTVQNGRHEGVYLILLYNDGTCLAGVNVTLHGPPLSPDLPSSTASSQVVSKEASVSETSGSTDLYIGIPIGILMLLVGLMLLVRLYQYIKKRGSNESSQSTTAECMINL